MSETLEVLTVSELAKILKVDDRTIYRKVDVGEIPGVFRIGSTGAIRFAKHKVMEWIENSKTR